MYIVHAATTEQNNSGANIWLVPWLHYTTKLLKHCTLFLQTLAGMHTHTDMATCTENYIISLILNFMAITLTSRAIFILYYTYGCVCGPSLESINSNYIKVCKNIYQQCPYHPVLLSWCGERSGQHAVSHRGGSGTDLPARQGMNVWVSVCMWVSVCVSVCTSEYNYLLWGWQ
jgi:hypothetical protein